MLNVEVDAPGSGPEGSVTTKAWTNRPGTVDCTLRAPYQAVQKRWQQLKCLCCMTTLALRVAPNAAAGHLYKGAPQCRHGPGREHRPLAEMFGFLPSKKIDARAPHSSTSHDQLLWSAGPACKLAQKREDSGEAYPPAAGLDHGSCSFQATTLNGPRPQQHQQRAVFCQGGSSSDAFGERCRTLCDTNTWKCLWYVSRSSD